MDTLLQKFSNSMNKFKFDHIPLSFPSNGYLLNEYEFNSSPDFFSPNPTPNNLSPDEADPNNNAVLKFISDILMEEDLEGKTCMLQDSLALQATEKSLYDVLGQEYPHSMTRNSRIFESPDSSSVRNSSFDSSNSHHVAVDNFGEKFNWSLDQIRNLDLFGMQSSSVDSAENMLGLARKGIEDVNKLFINGDSLVLTPSSNSPASSDRDNSPSSSQGRKNHEREDSDYLEEERSNKHSALSLAESEHSEKLFDQVLLCPGGNMGESDLCPFNHKYQNSASVNEKSKVSNSRKGRGRRQKKKGEVVDLPTLLTQCAQSVSINDQRTATDLLRQIRQHSSATGDGNQRLAHYFANALVTRLAGTSTPAYSPLWSIKTPVSDILKAYQVYVRACPFKKMLNFFANQTIYKLAEKATRLHIIDFGIAYGFQWPCLIQRLSQRPGGPPKLRITGIELPQPGFRPAERVEETGRRLKRYCERFNVPFDYQAVAQKLETIKYEDLHIDEDEMTVVNCLCRFRNLPDDTVVANSARDAVLDLIKKIRPEIFIHGVVNGTFTAPFFITRFREALFHYSSLFDMFEVNMEREDEQRVLCEKEIFGREIMNVLACEGIERVERPETYKQWQARNMRAGFRQLSLDQQLLKQVKCTVRSQYHKDFVIDENGRWMLQGWKGRVIYALSVWKPVQD